MKRLVFEVDGKQVRVDLTNGMLRRLLRRFDWRKAHVRCAFCEEAAGTFGGCGECRLAVALKSAEVKVVGDRHTPPCSTVPGASRAVFMLPFARRFGETEARGILDRFREHLMQWAARGEREKRDEKGAEHVEKT